MTNEMGMRLKSLRLSRGMTQQQVADLVGAKTYTTVSKWESGENSPQGKDIRILSEFYKVSSDTLLGLENMPRLRILEHSYNLFPTSVSAGDLCSIESSAPERISIPDIIMGKHAGNDDVFFLHVNGDSMNEVIPHESLIAVKKIEIEELKDDDIVVFSNDHEYSVKRYYNDVEDKRFIFSAESTDRRFTDHTVKYENADELIIHGKVVLYIVKP